jgi:hypothetical protein
MRRDFMMTRILLVLGAVVLGLIWLLRSDPSPQIQESPPTQATLTPTWEEQLSTPEILSLWSDRRLHLDRLSRAYLDEPDSSTREALRRELERLIDESEKEINALRQQQGGNQ